MVARLEELDPESRDLLIKWLSPIVENLEATALALHAIVEALTPFSKIVLDEEVP